MRKLHCLSLMSEVMFVEPTSEVGRPHSKPAGPGTISTQRCRQTSLKTPPRLGSIESFMRNRSILSPSPVEIDVFDRLGPNGLPSLFMSFGWRVWPKAFALVVIGAVFSSRSSYQRHIARGPSLSALDE